MKILGLSVALLTVTAVAAQAEVSAKITDVHICCKSCVTGVEKAIAEVPGAKAEVDPDARTVTFSGPDAATVQKAAKALVKAGYFGKSSDPNVKLDARTGAKGKTVQSLKVERVHLCCAKCVKAVDKAVKAVPGVKEQTATKGAKAFEVTGEFNDKDVLTALQEAGFAAVVAE